MRRSSRDAPARGADLSSSAASRRRHSWREATFHAAANRCSARRRAAFSAAILAPTKSAAGLWDRTRRQVRLHRPPRDGRACGADAHLRPIRRAACTAIACETRAAAIARTERRTTPPVSAAVRTATSRLRRTMRSAANSARARSSIAARSASRSRALRAAAAICSRSSDRASLRARASWRRT